MAEQPTEALHEDQVVDAESPSDEPRATPEEAVAVPPRPFLWDELSADDLEHRWHDLDVWVDWLRRTYGLPASVIPPAWHRHPELVWELSALHLHWLGCYHPHNDPSAPLAWHRDFADAQQRLRDWTATSGTRLDRDQPTHQTSWPGEPLTHRGGERPIVDRRADFHTHVHADVTQRRNQH